MFNISGLAWNSGVAVLGLAEDLSGSGSQGDAAAVPRAGGGLGRVSAEMERTVTRSVDCVEGRLTLNGELLDWAYVESSE